VDISNSCSSQCLVLCIWPPHGSDGVTYAKHTVCFCYGLRNYWNSSPPTPTLTQRPPPYIHVCHKPQITANVETTLAFDFRYVGLTSDCHVMPRHLVQVSCHLVVRNHLLSCCKTCVRKKELSSVVMYDKPMCLVNTTIWLTS
jgi:hypothetical protein